MKGLTKITLLTAMETLLNEDKEDKVYFKDDNGYKRVIDYDWNFTDKGVHGLYIKRFEFYLEYGNSKEE